MNVDMGRVKVMSKAKCSIAPLYKMLMVFMYMCVYIFYI